MTTLGLLTLLCATTPRTFATLETDTHTLRVAQLDDTGVTVLSTSPQPQAVDVLWLDAHTLVLLELLDDGHRLQFLRDLKPAETIAVPPAAWGALQDTADNVRLVAEGAKLWLERDDDKPSWLWVDSTVHRSARGPKKTRTASAFPVSARGPSDVTVTLQPPRYYAPNRQGLGPLVVETKRRAGAAVTTRGFACVRGAQRVAWEGDEDGNMPFVERVEWLASSLPFFVVHAKAFTPVRSTVRVKYVFLGCAPRSLASLQWLGGDTWLAQVDEGDDNTTRLRWHAYVDGREVGVIDGSLVALVP